MKDGGYTNIIEEYRVITTGGFKDKRYGDLFGISPDGKDTIFQVGRQTKSGLPVSRERKAKLDIEQYSNIDVFFDAYNSIE